MTESRISKLIVIGTWCIGMMFLMTPYPELGSLIFSGITGMYVGTLIAEVVE